MENPLLPGYPLLPGSIKVFPRKFSPPPCSDVIKPLGNIFNVSFYIRIEVRNFFKSTCYLMGYLDISNKKIGLICHLKESHLLSNEIQLKNFQFSEQQHFGRSQLSPWNPLKNSRCISNV